jgi:DNA-binding transcriptional MocR family regulator
VEVTIEDIALANELAQDVLARGLDELAAPVRGLYDELRKRAEEMNCQPDAVLLSRREIREATGWSDWQVRSYCRQLVEMEYLYATVNGNGRPCVYSLARAEENDGDGLRGLTDVAELQQRLMAHASSL